MVAGAAGLALAAGSGALIRNLNERATFSYDGLAYSGPGVKPIAPNDKFYTVTKNVVDPNVDVGDLAAGDRRAGRGAEELQLRGPDEPGQQSSRSRH